MFLRVRVCSERQVQLSDDATQKRAVLFARTGGTVHLSWGMVGWDRSVTLVGADKWDCSCALAGADGLALKFVLDLGTRLRELFLCFGNLYAVEDALQAVFAIEIADCLEADDGGHSAVCEALNGAVNESRDRTAQEGDAAGGVAHRFDDGVADLQGTESVRNERIAYHCAEDLDELCVRGAETV